MRIRSVLPMLLIASLLTACSTTAQHSSTQTRTGVERVSGGPAGSYLVPSGIHKIQHVIVIMQENRSFDSYFGTFPGADGIPMQDGSPTVCVPNPPGPCEKPYRDTADVNGGGPHGEASAVADVDSGAMDGFIGQVQKSKSTCTNPTDPACEVLPGSPADVMGYHDASEIPNYWTYAKDFVLDDHMFEPVKSWSLPDHLYLVSGWSAKCKSTNPYSCVNAIVGPYTPAQMQKAVVQEVDTGTT
ncbi:MAG: alkaline phosphatase family protein, partial [Isosphaeraceae bacterium]